MSLRGLLLVVMIAGPVIALVASVWGTLAEQSARKRTGDKRLSRSGQVSVALAVAGALAAVAALGLETVITSQEDLAATKAQQDAARETDRRRAEDRRWQALRLEQLGVQQRFLADLQREEAARQAAGILGSQRLFAAVEAQRDRGIAAAGRLFQIAQSQQIILQSQPLASLDLQLTIGGFSQSEFAALAEGAEEVAGYSESDDNYGRLVDVRQDNDNINLFRKVLRPAILQLAGRDPQAEAGSVDAVLALDLSGEGAWLLPIGVTEQERGRGFVVNAAWLSDVGRAIPNGAGEQDFGLCRFPSITLDPARRVIVITWLVQGVCLPTAMHRAADIAVTARLAERPVIVAFRGRPPFPGVATGLRRGSNRATDNCWRPAGSTGGSRFIELVAVPNGNPAIGIRRRLGLGGEMSVNFQVTNEDDPDLLGVCTRFE